MNKAVQIFQNISNALAAAHSKGIVHGDLKPENILVNENGETVIIDFGIARVIDDNSTRDRFSGTLAYMSPERKKGQSISLQSDIYSLGLILSELFCSEDSNTNSSVPEHIIALRNKCIEKDPQGRFENAAELSEAIEKTVSTILPKEKKTSRFSLKSICLILITIILLTTSSVFLFSNRNSLKIKASSSLQGFSSGKIMDKDFSTSWISGPESEQYLEIFSGKEISAKMSLSCMGKQKSGYNNY